jgi:RNA polymerase sigma-70 factor, ECF subfamily
MAHPPADRLLSLLACGQPEAYAELYNRVAGPLMRAARVMLGRGGAAGEAEDAVQDVFVELARNRHRLPLVRDLDAYLFSMLRYAAGRRIRQHRAEHRHLRQMMPTDVASAPAASAAASDSESALLSLPAEQREVIALKVDGGLTFAQVGDVLGISPNTAASRYRYAIEKLRRALE